MQQLLALLAFIHDKGKGFVSALKIFFQETSTAKLLLDLRHI